MIKKAAGSWVAAMLVLSALGATRADAADVNQRFSVRGLGTTTCGKYLESRNLNADETDQYAHWFTGFLTAYNWLKPDTYDIAPASKYKQIGLLRFFDIYCGNNPKKRLIDAAMDFANAIHEKRVKVGS